MTNKGVDRLRSEKLAIEVSELGCAVAQLLDDVWSGIYHMDMEALAKVDWANPHHISVQVAHMSLATYDSNKLTLLIVRSHDLCLRMEISALKANTLGLMFHLRKREGSWWESVPTMETHVADIRKYYPVKGGEAA